MTESIDTTTGAANSFERLKWGCLWGVLNPLWIILLGASAYFGWSNWNTSRQGEPVKGIVTSMRQVAATRAGGVSTYAPSISYQVNGQTYLHHSSNSSFPPANKVGDTIHLRYQPGDPNDVQDQSWLSLWMLPSLLGAAGLVVAIVAIPLTLFARRRRDRILTLPNRHP